MPGTPLIDTNPIPRWDGVLTVVDVDQTFDAKGARATLYCSSTNATRLIASLTALIRELAGRDALRSYQYRFVLMQGSKVALQAVDPTAGVPDIIPLDVWGAAGDSATYTPGAQVAVTFLNGDKGRPAILAWDPTLPLTKTVDATVELDLGPSSLLVKLAGGAQPLALGAGLTALINILITAFTGMNPTTLAGQATTAAGALTALSTQPIIQTIKTVAA